MIKKPDFHINEQAWLVLVVTIIESQKNIESLLKSINNFRQTDVLPIKVAIMLSRYEEVITKKQSSQSYETKEATFLDLKLQLAEQSMAFIPMETNEEIRFKYISMFSEAIPGFAAEWNEDVDFRQGDNSLVMLFVFLSGSLASYDEIVLKKIFQIIDYGLTDSEDCVQAAIIRGILLSMIKNKTIDNYYQYMPDTTLKFSQYLSPFWQN